MRSAFFLVRDDLGHGVAWSDGVRLGNCMVVLGLWVDEFNLREIHKGSDMKVPLGLALLCPSVS